MMQEAWAGHITPSLPHLQLDICIARLADELRKIILEHPRDMEPGRKLDQSFNSVMETILLSLVLPSLQETLKDLQARSLVSRQSLEGKFTGQAQSCRLSSECKAASAFIPREALQRFLKDHPEEFFYLKVMSLISQNMIEL